MRLAACALALGLAGCASLPPPATDSNCSADYRGIDAQLEARHATNAGAHRIEGFPYLRSDRFLASFRSEVPDGPRFEAWVERLRRLDLTSRAPELRQLGWRNPQEELAHLDRCGAASAAQDLADPARRAALRKAAEVPDDYSLLKRTLGLYPLTVPFLRLGMANFNSGVREDYARPADQLNSPGPLTLWRGPQAAPAPQAAAWLAQRDALGIPQLSDSQWQALEAAHLPNWLIETAGEFDRPGTPTMDGGRRGFDAQQPATYFATGYTRFGGRVLAQLIYVVWFSERPRAGVFDAYGGELDGVVWRVTLDERGLPLLYDTVHACGCYHYFFSAQPLVRKPEPGLLQEPVMYPQEPAPAEPPNGNGAHQEPALHEA